MADQKLSALTETTAPALTHEFYTEATGNAAGLMVQLGNLLTIPAALLSDVSVVDGAVTVTPAKMTINQAGTSIGGLVSDPTNSKITVGATGYYYVAFGGSLTSTTTPTANIYLYWNGASKATLQVELQANITVPFHVHTIVDATTASTDIEAYWSVSSSTHGLTGTVLSLVAFRLAPT